jgi:hypothetical protein
MVTLLSALFDWAAARPKTVARGFARGQALTIIIPALAVLIGGMALCADFSVTLHEWMILRKAADAAALAGATYLLPATTGASTLPPITLNGSCGFTSQAENVACTYALQNFAQISDISAIEYPAPDYSGSTQTIEVVLKRTTVPVLFLRALSSLSDYTVGAMAIAEAPTAASTIRNGLFPAGMPADPNGGALTYGESFQLTGSYSPGNWGWLNIPADSSGGSSASTAPQGTDSGSSNLANNIEYGCTCTASVGQWFNTETGVNAGPVASAMAAIGVSSTPTPLPSTLTGNEPQLVTVPVVDWSTASGGSGAVQILGFAEVWLSSYTKSSSTELLTVQFVQYVSKFATAGGAANSFGAYAPAQLVE